MSCKKRVVPTKKCFHWLIKNGAKFKFMHFYWLMENGAKFKFMHFYWLIKNGAKFKFMHFYWLMENGAKIQIIKGWKSLFLGTKEPNTLEKGVTHSKQEGDS